MVGNPFCRYTVRELLADYRARALSPREVVAATLDHIASVNPVLNAHWQVLPEAAAEQAVESEARWRDGRARPLEGVPVGVKDVIDVAGEPCTGGSRIYRQRRADADATAVARLRNAGAIVVTKDATTEFGIGGPHNPAYGPTVNPWNVGHWTGGSSCGAASGLAAGTVPAALGTDAGGSVRIPASWSGVVGLKPTMGRVSRRGVMPCSWHAEVVGPMARSVPDALLLLSVTAGADPADQRTRARTDTAELALPDDDVATLRVGIAPSWWEELADPPTREAVTGAVDLLRNAGARVVRIDDLPPLQELHDLIYAIIWTEAAWAHRSHTTHHELMDPVAVSRLGAGLDVTAPRYFSLLERRTQAQRRMFAALSDVDALITPTTVTTAPRLDNLNVTVGETAVPLHQGYALLTAHANLTGFPAVAVPAGLAPNGLPLSVQFVGGPWREAAVCRVGRVYERLAGHRLDAPDLARAPRLARPGVSADGPDPAPTHYLAGTVDADLDQFIGR